MAIRLITYDNSTVQSQHDAQLYESITPSCGVFDGLFVALDPTIAHVSAGRGMIAGRYFECDETALNIELPAAGTAVGAVYIHMDLANVDEPIKLIAGVRPEYQKTINAQNTAGVFDMELAYFTLSPSGVVDNTAFQTSLPVETNHYLKRGYTYDVGDCVAIPGVIRYMLLCTRRGRTAMSYPKEYRSLWETEPTFATVEDGTAEFAPVRSRPELSRIAFFVGSERNFTQSGYDSLEETPFPNVDAQECLLIVHATVECVDGCDGDVWISSVSGGTHLHIIEAEGVATASYACMVHGNLYDERIHIGVNAEYPNGSFFGTGVKVTVSAEAYKIK